MVEPLPVTESAPSNLRSIATAQRLATREVLAAAWPLFQVSLPGCLPLALLGVAASGLPGAEAVASGEGRGFVHGPMWWALYVASTLLMVLCYSGVLRQQLARSAGRRLGMLASLRDSLAGALPTLGVVMLVVVLAVAGGVLLLLPGIAVLVWTFLAWTAQLDEGLGPLAALRRSVALVRGRFVACAGILGATIAAVLVFVLLTGILLAVVMNLAGADVQSGHAGLSFSRWLMSGLLALPVVYVGAVTVAAWRAALAGPTRAGTGGGA
jgi:hypothetical protein